ncbi:Esterase/Lipase [Mycena indigotica]|uniref:Esterase/Lipase n=1 Tax=Mycena indigotica TaxID=2126181 RepID=A0A8H6S6P1_9AGAR|nr:Esterase/Lipase [Mycena indigotica]KAF7293081.1 Esterase/Lipase [Mycena indigotica]
MSLVNRAVKTQRGLAYAYYFAKALPNKPTLLFAHGFPTPAYVWRRQITFFEQQGFGIIAPDLLGYGGTDKPTDPKLYVGSGLAQDIVDILDQEGVSQVISVSHDWGSRVVSRIANYYPDRLVACAFLGVGYGPPASNYADPITQSAQIKSLVGYDVLAYMQYFVEPNAHVLMEKNFDSFFSLLFPLKRATEEIWRENMCEAGKAKVWIESNRTTELPEYMTAEDKEYYTHALVGGGLSAPLCWYQVLVEQYNAEDDAKIPEEAYVLQKPVLFVAFNKDPIGLPTRMFAMATHEQYVKPDTNLTNKAVEGDHWALLSHADEVNTLLLEWIEGI